MRLAYLIAAALLAPPAAAEPVMLDGERLSVTVETEGVPVVIERNQDNDAVAEREWTLTSRACPPFCIQPMSPAEGVTTIGELELIEALQDPDTVVLDSRLYDWYAGGTIPGARHLPWDQVVDRLGELGCTPDFDGWDCAEAPRVALFCNGAWCGQSPTAIRSMIAAGYPAERILYYRGGMQAWRLLGLTVVQPGEQ